MKPILSFLVFATMLMLSGVAYACPDCALINSGGVIEPQTVAAKMAFSWSTLCLLCVFFSVVGCMVWAMVKTCRDLAKEKMLSGLDTSSLQA